MAQPYITFVGVDMSGERTGLSLYFPNITGANFAAMTTLVGQIYTALADITLCGWKGYDWVTEVHTEIASLPSSPYAQIERRAIFQCIDSVSGRQFEIGVPAPDMLDMAIQGTDAINLTNLEVAAYVASLGANAVSPQGNPFTVISGVVIGVNS